MSRDVGAAIGRPLEANAGRNTAPRRGGDPVKRHIVYKLFEDMVYNFSFPAGAE